MFTKYLTIHTVCNATSFHLTIHNTSDKIISQEKPSRLMFLGHTTLNKSQSPDLRRSRKLVNYTLPQDQGFLTNWIHTT